MVRTSATARAMPAEWVTQTASAIQKPSTSGDWPTIEPPSGVKEKIPLNPSAISVSRSAGNSSCDAFHAGSKSSGVNSSRDGMCCASTCFGVSPSEAATTGMGRWP